MLRAIDRKVLRDIWRLRAQLAAIALVITCGVGLFVGMRTTMLALETARADYYAREHFADVFASLVRAPEHVADRLRAIPGVARVQTRVVASVVLDVPGATEPATGRLVSLDPLSRPAVNDIRMRVGRRPVRGGGTEAIALEPFAAANELEPGDELVAVIDGKRTRLKIVGTAVSPEFTYSLGPGKVLPDDRRFGVLWMTREALGHAFDMDGAFNDVALQLGRDADLEAVIAAVDRVLETHGGAGAFRRADQISESFVANELAQLRSFGMLVPAMFLLVAAFLLNVVIARIVAGQREQIAAMKAVGYRDGEIGLHYAKLVGVVVAVGASTGIALAAWLGSVMCRMYGEFYRFPDLAWSMPASEVVLALGTAIVAAAFGTTASIRRAVRLPPAEAMRPPAPPVYRATLLERIGLARLVSPAARMVLREIERRPGRAVFTVTGIALATALVVITTFAYGSIQKAMNVEFGLQQRDDVTLALARPRRLATITEIGHLPGVLHAEPFRAVPVRLRSGSRHDDVALTGIPSGATLHAVLDVDLRDVAPRGEGLVLTRKLAEKLRVAAGSVVTVEVREGARAVREVSVARVAETYVGMSAYMELDALCGMLGETPTMNGAWLLVDETLLPALHAAVKSTPIVAGITERRHTLEGFQTMIDDNLGVSLAIDFGFALVMALGVLYNTARITLAERARDLASLRVLGFRRREVTAILLGELGALTVVAIPIGLLLGRGAAAGMMESLDTEQLRLPLLIEPWTYAAAALVTIVASMLAGFLAWRRLESIPVVDVLKSRD